MPSGTWTKSVVVGGGNFVEEHDFATLDIPSSYKYTDRFKANHAYYADGTDEVLQKGLIEFGSVYNADEMLIRDNLNYYIHGQTPSPTITNNVDFLSLQCHIVTESFNIETDSFSTLNNLSTVETTVVSDVPNGTYAYLEWDVNNVLKSMRDEMDQITGYDIYGLEFRTSAQFASTPPAERQAIMTPNWPLNFVFVTT